METELHLPDDAPVVVEAAGGLRAVGSVLSCEDFQILLLLDRDLNDKVSSAYLMVHSMVRIKGKNTVEMIKALTDIETVVVGQNIRKLDNKKSKLVTNSFAASSGNLEDNGSILNYGLGAFVEEKEFCPKCKNRMILAKNDRGTAYLKCSNKACKETKYLTVDLMNWYINSHNIKCPKRDIQVMLG